VEKLMKKYFLAATLLSLVSLSAPALAVVEASAEPATTSTAETATLRVKFVVDGKVPAPEKIDGGRDAFCAPLTLTSEKLIVGKNGELKNLALILDTRRTKTELPKTDVPKDKLELDNKNCVFVPHILVVRAGQTVTVLNSDQTGHNANFAFFNNPPVNVLIPVNGSKDVDIDKDERAPIPVECNIHPWMKAFVIVQDHPFVGVTDENGVLEIQGLPAGEIAFRVWHESADGALDEAVVKGKKEKWSRGTMEITLKPGVNDLGEVKIPAAKFKK
jgi:plastocyanin